MPQRTDKKTICLNMIVKNESAPGYMGKAARKHREGFVMTETH